MHKFFLFFLFVCQISIAQLQFSNQVIDVGTIAETSEIKGDIILKNAGDKKIFLMRADADNGVKVFVSKKTLQANDTCLMIISFVPEVKGAFKKKIYLVASDKAKPHEIILIGTVLNVRPDNTTACFYFGSRNKSTVPSKTDAIIIPDTKQVRDNSNKMPDVSNQPVVLRKEEPKEIVKEEKQNNFSEVNYKPNNVLFLVDVSTSMKDSLKLPLMKKALHVLIDNVRAIDSISFVTYATKVKVLKEAVSGANKRELHALLDSLKARGGTSGTKAILQSQQIAQKHFIMDGNNQIILATDGKFRFDKEHYDIWKNNQGNKKIIVSTVAFGNEREALKNLKDIARKCDGSFIHFKSSEGSDEKLLKEIKERSRK